jgi:hypothetical protein
MCNQNVEKEVCVGNRKSGESPKAFLLHAACKPKAGVSGVDYFCTHA